MIHLHEIQPSDLEEVARFISRVSGSNTPIAVALERLRWIVLQNPAREPTYPLGWILRTDAGEIAGSLCCAPQKFCLEQKKVTFMMAHSFYVDEQHQGGGASIFLKYLRLGRDYPLFVSSANPIVAEMWGKLGGFSLGNSDHEDLGIVGWRPLLAESVYRKTGSDRLAHFASTLIAPWFGVRRQLLPRVADGELSRLDTAEQAAGVCSEVLSEKITACRDAAFLQWRYFSGPDRKTRLFAFLLRSGERKSMVAVEIQNRGYKKQIRALQVLDIWGEAGPEACLSIADCLWREYRQQIDILVFRCLDPAQEKALKANGFRLRSFPAPIAWCIDRHGLLPSRSCYFVPADGDMFL